MARGKPIPEELAWTVIRLLPLFSVEDVSAFTGISTTKIQDIATMHATTGIPVRPPSDRKKGRKRALTATEVDVSCTNIFP